MDGRHIAGRWRALLMQAELFREGHKRRRRLEVQLCCEALMKHREGGERSWAVIARNQRLHQSELRHLIERQQLAPTLGVDQCLIEPARVEFDTHEPIKRHCNLALPEGPLLLDPFFPLGRIVEVQTIEEWATVELCGA